MGISVHTGLEREIKFLVTGPTLPTANILRTSLIRQTHLGSDENVIQLFNIVKGRISARIQYLVQNGVTVIGHNVFMQEIESALLVATTGGNKMGRKYNLRVRLEKTPEGRYISTLTCKKVLSSEGAEEREKMEYDIVIPKEIAIFLLGVRKEVLQNTKSISGVKKRRYYFETPDRHHWCHDKFLGANYGLETVEVELQHEGSHETPIPGTSLIPGKELGKYSMRKLQKKTDKRFSFEKKSTKNTYTLIQEILKKILTKVKIWLFRY